MKPIAYDLFCGLGGWTEGLLAEGYDATGYDIEAHEYGDQKYPAKLALQDVLTIHGSQFKDAALIVASPPCQAYSYMAMPWSRAKQIAAALRHEKGVEFPEGYAGPRTIDNLNALFNACFRIQREACEAAGRYIPMVVENVKGAQPWVGPAKAHYGSFYLWGDVEMVGDRIIAGGLRFGDSVKAAKRGAQKRNPDGTEHGQGSWFKIADSKDRGARGEKNDGGSWFAIGSPGQTNVGQNPDGRKVPGMNFHDFEKTGKPGRSFQSAAVDGIKVASMTGWDKHGEPGYKPMGFNVEAARRFREEKDTSGWSKDSPVRNKNSKSDSRKAASAQIAKIPLPLSSYIARSYYPREDR